MNEPTNADLLARLDVIDAKLNQITVPSATRIEYSRREFAGFVGISADSLKKPKYWRRYGGRKRGGRIVFPEAARLAIAEGKK